MTQPFSIASVAIVSGGCLGIAPLPGGSGPLEADLRTIYAWAPDLVVSLTGQAEMDAVGVGTLGQTLADRRLPWVQMPIVDFGTPDEQGRKIWPDLGKRIHAILDGDGRVLIHCKGGRGRSGMLLLRVLIERGEDPQAALQRLRAVRPGAVETEEQFFWAERGLA